MTPVSYDQAVPYYDLTRGYPDGVPEQIRAVIIKHTGADKSSRFLELAIGTGLLGVPFIQAGYDYHGVDISPQMMAQIQQKLGHPSNSPKLVQANLMQPLPFPDASFDVVNAIRVFHLLDDVPYAIREAMRVLRSNGYLLIARDASPNTAEDPFHIAHAKWDDILESIGIKTGSIRPGLLLSEEHIITFLEVAGATVEQVDLLHYQHFPLSIRDIADRHKQRMYSRDWELSEPIHTQAVQLLATWLDHECLEPDKKYQKPMIFRALIARWNT